jgi:hypothetical protein
MFAHGHSVLGIHFSLHSAYGQLGDYEQAAMREAHGEERAAEVLQRSAAERRHLPQPVAQELAAGHPGHPPAGRRPHAGRGLELPGRAGGPDLLLFERALTLQPPRVLADVDRGARRPAPVREHAAAGWRAGRNEWVSLHRNQRRRRVRSSRHSDVGGTNEILMRNQFRAWAKAMEATA